MIEEHHVFVLTRNTGSPYGTWYLSVVLDLDQS
jgi:hypothetical protein